MATDSHGSHSGFKIAVEGGAGYRKLRDYEYDSLSKKLNQFSEETTKISAEEIEFKKDLVKWLVKQLKDEALRGRLWRTYNTGSAYEKVQAGEAKDFDVMIYLNVRRWKWKVEDDPDKPGFCRISRGEERPEDKPNSFTHLLDSNGYLSSLKVRKLIMSGIDKYLRKNNPLEFNPAAFKKKEQEAANKSRKRHSEEKTTLVLNEELMTESFKVDVKRKQQGPSTTLLVECKAKGIKEFTLDLVNSLHCHHVHSKEKCDFVAKPYDKQHVYGSQYEDLWRKSYSRKESSKLKDIDHHNKIHKKLLRIFKILRANQPQLKFLKTYIFKNLLLHVSDVEGKDWSEKGIAHRFVDMIIALRNCLASKVLPIYCNPRINLLQCQQEEYGEKQLNHVMGYLKRMANKGIEGYESFLSIKITSEPSLSDVSEGKTSLKRKQPATAADESQRIRKKKSCKSQELANNDSITPSAKTKPAAGSNRKGIAKSKAKAKSKTSQEMKSGGDKCLGKKSCLRTNKSKTCAFHSNKQEISSSASSHPSQQKIDSSASNDERITALLEGLDLDKASTGMVLCTTETSATMATNAEAKTSTATKHQTLTVAVHSHTVPDYHSEDGLEDTLDGYGDFADDYVDDYADDYVDDYADDYVDDYADDYVNDYADDNLDYYG